MTGGQVPDALIAEHGFSALVTVARGGREHRFLFDTGASPDGVTENMRRLGVDPGSIEAIVRSHGHFDHTAGIDGLVRTLGRGPPAGADPIRTSGGGAGSSSPAAIRWSCRRPAGRALTGAGFEIIEEQQPSFLFDRTGLVTGEVPRVTGYGPAFRPSRPGWTGAWQPDPLVLDDQALIFQVAEQGAGGDHRLRARGGGEHRALRPAADRRPAPLRAGRRVHLNGPLFEPLIPRVLDDLAELNPGVLVPAHCTGWRAQHALAGRFRDAFVPNSVGTSFFL